MHREVHHWQDFAARSLRRAGQRDVTDKPRQCPLPTKSSRPSNLVHGGATWNSQVNRDQVRDGAAIPAFLMPVFVDVMMDHPDEDWGRPFYPGVQ